MDKKSQEQYRFDEYGRYVKMNTVKPNINKKPNPNLIRLHRIEKVVNYWKSIGPDFRFHITAVGLCFVCFFSVFLPAIYYEDRLINMESKALILREALDKTNYHNYIYKKFGMKYDVMEHYQSP